jgi:hypothetical protein
LHIRKDKTAQVVTTTIACLALLAYLVYLVYPISKSTASNPQCRGWIIFAITIIIFCVVLYLIVQQLKDSDVKIVATPNGFIFNNTEVLREDLVLYLSTASTEYNNYRYNIKVLDTSKGSKVNLANNLSARKAKRILSFLENFLHVSHRVEQDFWESF